MDQECSRQKYFILRLLRNSFGCYYISFFSALFCMISFLNYFKRISFRRTYFSLSRKIISFFYYYKRRFAHSASRLFNFYVHTLYASLCYAYNFMIYDSIQEIISIVTTFVFPFRIFYLLYLIFYQISLIRLFLVTLFS